jgi:hypothetical protein
VNGPDNGSADVLTALIRKAKAEAWDEAFDAFYEELANGMNPSNDNPYAETPTQVEDTVTHKVISDASGVWCASDCPRPDDECAALAVVWNNR